MLGFLTRPNRPGPPSDAAVDPNAQLQWWYFDAVLDDGSRLVTFFIPRARWRILGGQAGMPVFNVALRRPNGECIRERRFFDPDQLRPFAPEFGASFGNDCSAAFEPGGQGRRAGRYILKAVTDRIRYDLVLTPEVASWTPLAAKGYVPRPILMMVRRSLFVRDYLHYAAFVPRGRLEGRIEVDGKTFHAKGIGYHEQGRLTLPLYELTPAWYWLHIEEPPWTILAGTVEPPAGLASSTFGGFAYVHKGGKCLMACLDYSGLFVKWTRIGRRDPRADGEMNMAWEADVRCRRPGFSLRAAVVSTDVLEYMPFDYAGTPTSVTPYWGQTVAEAKVEIRHGRQRVRLDAGAFLETMATGYKL